MNEELVETLGPLLELFTKWDFFFNKLENVHFITMHYEVFIGVVKVSYKYSDYNLTFE